MVHQGVVIGIRLPVARDQFRPDTAQGFHGIHATRMEPHATERIGGDPDVERARHLQILSTGIDAVVHQYSRARAGIGKGENHERADRTRISAEQGMGSIGRHFNWDSK